MLDTPDICEFCGENVATYGRHKPTCTFVVDAEAVARQYEAERQAYLERTEGPKDAA